MIKKKFKINKRKDVGKIYKIITLSNEVALQLKEFETQLILLM